MIDMYAILNGNRIEDHILAYVLIAGDEIRVQGEVIKEEDKKRYSSFFSTIKDGDNLSIECKDGKGLIFMGMAKVARVEVREVKFKDRLRLAFFFSLRKLSHSLLSS